MARREDGRAANSNVSPNTKMGEHDRVLCTK